MEKFCWGWRGWPKSITGASWGVSALAALAFRRLSSERRANSFDIPGRDSYMGAVRFSRGSAKRFSAKAVSRLSRDNPRNVAPALRAVATALLCECQGLRQAPLKDYP